MDIEAIDLPRLIRGPEGLYFERKSLLVGPGGNKRPRDRREVRDQVAEYVAAFANADGGTLVLGVEDDGTPTGHAYPPGAVDDILAVPERRLTPPLRRGERARVAGNELLVFQVEAAASPVMVQGNGYPCRVGDEVVAMEAHKIAAWKEQGLVETWEARRSERRLEDLDPLLLQRAIAGSVLRVDSVEQYLLRRRLADMRGPTLVLRKAAELLFAREAHLIDHPHAGVRLFRVVGTERKLGALHNVEELPRFEGNAASIIEELFKTVQGLLRRPKRLRGLRFEEAPEYPTFAWQEAIINAVAHRDYALTGRSIEVWLYDDRMEVLSPGGLVAEVALEALHGQQRVHMSRNPRLVRGLVDLGFMREQGEGIPRMFAEMEVQFLAPPELRASKSEFSVTLRNAPVLRAEDAEWLAALQAEQLSEAQARAMALVRLRGAVSNATLRDATGLDTLAASVALRDLRDRGLLEMQGAGSASYYVAGPRTQTLSEQPGGPPLVPSEAPKRGELPTDRGELPTDRGELPTDRGELPTEVQELLATLGPKPRKERLWPVIRRLCALRAWRPAELARVLSLASPEKLVERHLGPMCDAGMLVRLYPETPSHPEQAYRAVQMELPQEDSN